MSLHAVLPKWLLAWLIAWIAVPSHAQALFSRTLPLPEIRSGIASSSIDLQKMQADDFGNPGMLWIERGAKLWSAAPANQKSCTACHGDASQSMKGVALRYPALVPVGATQSLLNLEGRINLCRTTQQRQAAFAFESDELLALTALVAHQSRGQPLKREMEEALKPHFSRAKDLYFTRVGQLNLACNHCHEINSGKRLLQETISQGHGNGYPAYRLEWQSLGSLQRRLRACFSGVRAVIPAFGSEELNGLELFLQWRGEGLSVETPAVRR